MRRSIHGVLLLVSIFAAIPVVGWVVFPKAGHALPAFGGCAGALVAGFLEGGAIDDSCTARIERPPYVVR